MAHQNTLPWLINDITRCFLFYLLQCLLVFITGAFPILAYCADKHRSQYFQDIIRESLGPRAYFTTKIIVLFNMFGCTVAYMILIGDQLEKGMWSFSFLRYSSLYIQVIMHLLTSLVHHPGWHVAQKRNPTTSAGPFSHSSVVTVVWRSGLWLVMAR